MLTAYIEATLRKAHYEILPDNEGYFGRIEGLQGVWANANNLETCREELREVLEEWVILGLELGIKFPKMDAAIKEWESNNLRIWGKGEEKSPVFLLPSPFLLLPKRSSYLILDPKWWPCFER